MRWRNIGFSFLFLIIPIGLSFAEPGVKITQPQDNSIVNPGQQITVTVEAVEGFVISYGTIGVSNFLVERFSSLPVTFTATIPSESSGTIPVWVIAKDVSRNDAGEMITLKVQQTATLQSLEINQDEISVDLDWNGNINENPSNYIRSVYGIYSDGIKRYISNDPNTTYTSSDPSVISIDDKGNYIINKIGEATIAVSNSGVSKIIPVVFQKPTGIKPLETTPPTTQINIQPKPNSAGWNNSNITITITAKDNEGGSGIAEINYQWYNMSGKLEYVQNDAAVLYLSQEGRNHLRYYAVDKERNEEKESHDIEFKLDKTPPEIKLDISPNILWPPDHKMVDVKINGTATDKLSGVASTSFKVTDEYDQVETAISKFGDTIQLEAWRKGDDLDGRTYTISVTTTDYAGNRTNVYKTVTVPHDMRN